MSANVQHSTDASTRMANSGTLRSYLTLFKEEIVSVGVLSLVTNLLMLAPTLYMLQLYDRVLISKNELTLYAITLITCLLFLVIAFSEWMRSMIVVRAGVRFDQLLSSKVFALGFASSMGSQRSASGEAMNDLTYIRQFMTGNGLFAFFDIPWTLLYIAVLFILHPMLGVLAIVFCTCQFCLGVWNQRSSHQPLKDISTATLANQRFLDSKVRNIDTLHVMGMIPNLYQRWQRLQWRWNQLDGRVVAVQARNQSVNKFVRYTMQSLILAAAALLAIQGKISIGAMIASNVLIARALQPFDVIVSTWKQWVQTRQAADRLNQLLAMDTADQPLPQGITRDVLVLRGHVVMDKLSVTLAQDRPAILKAIDLEIQPGQILAVMGHSGSGKTTLLRCLAGLLSWKGELRLDGILANTIPHAQWAASIGYLPQDIELVPGTIADNIARFSTPQPTDVIAAAKAAGIHDSILRLPQGYDTRLDESAAVLSGGQRQLVGLARAIYQQPGLLLLDEPNAHLDEHGEANLLNSLQQLRQQGCAIVVVSHRAGILKIADRLMIMNNGEVAHNGPRDAVVAKLNQERQQLNAAAA